MPVLQVSSSRVRHPSDSSVHVYLLDAGGVEEIDEGCKHEKTLMHHSNDWNNVSTNPMSDTYHLDLNFGVPTKGSGKALAAWFPKLVNLEGSGSPWSWLF